MRSSGAVARLLGVVACVGCGQGAEPGPGDSDGGSGSEGDGDTSSGGQSSSSGGYKHDGGESDSDTGGDADVGGGGGEGSIGGDPGSDGGNDGTGAWTSTGGSENPPDPLVYCGPGPDDFPPLDLPTAGAECDSSVTSCSAGDPSKILFCQQGTWGEITNCDPGDACVPSQAGCGPVIGECNGETAGHRYCVGQSLFECLPGGAEVQEFECCGRCIDGACHATECGDELISGDETCDDGNDESGDGCDADCQPTIVENIALGDQHSCLLFESGAVRCWGDNSEGQLGLGSSDNWSLEHPKDIPLVPLDRAAVAITTGAAHTCVIVDDGHVRCWGRNDHGQLGLGHTDMIGDDESPSAEYAEVQLPGPAVMIDAGGDATCAVLVGGRVYCWGDNTYGQLGLGHTKTIGDNELPTKHHAMVAIEDAFKLLGVAGEHTCAVTTGNRVHCWGRNDKSQLGIGHRKNIGDDEPAGVASLIDLNQDARWEYFVMDADGGHTTVNQDDVNIWGNNEYFALGRPIQARETSKASDYGGQSLDAPVLSVAAGHFGNCAITQGEHMFCWGSSEHGELGKADQSPIGDDEISAGEPLSLGTIGSAEDFSPRLVAAGAHHVCVVGQGTALKCWGENAHGQLGLGFISDDEFSYVGGQPDETPDKLPLIQIVTDGE